MNSFNEIYARYASRSLWKWQSALCLKVKPYRRNYIKEKLSNWQFDNFPSHALTVFVCNEVIASMLKSLHLKWILILFLADDNLRIYNNSLNLLKIKGKVRESTRLESFACWHYMTIFFKFYYTRFDYKRFCFIDICLNIKVTSLPFSEKCFFPWENIHSVYLYILINDHNRTKFLKQQNYYFMNKLNTIFIQ